MYPLLVILVISAIASSIAMLTGSNLTLSNSNRLISQRQQQILIAENLEQYFVEHNAYPTTLQALAQTPGYEHVKTLFNPWQGYAVSGTLTDSNWQFQRMVAYTVDPTAGMTAEKYLSTNTCGTNDFFTDIQWCAYTKSIQYVKENKDGFNAAIDNQRARFRRTLQKIGNSYSINGGFPTTDQSNNLLTAGNTYSLVELAGFLGAANACNGIYTWNGIPLGCEDMFDTWGNPVGVAFTSKDALTLVSETPLFNAAGTKLVISAGFTI